MKDNQKNKKENCSCDGQHDHEHCCGSCGGEHGSQSGSCSCHGHSHDKNDEGCECCV